MTAPGLADAAETGVASEASNRRMSAWDTAVVDATLTCVDANDQFQANLLDCIKLAVRLERLCKSEQ